VIAARGDIDVLLPLCEAAITALNARKTIAIKKKRASIHISVAAGSAP